MSDGSDRNLKEKLIVSGGNVLSGNVDIQGAKNAALPVMAASLLLRGGRLTLTRVPDLHDTHTMSDLLRHLGATVEFDRGHMTIDVPEELQAQTPVDLVRKMRASSLVLGPLIARCKRALLPLPGGCAIGSRPIDLHLKGLVRMGAVIDLDHGSVCAETDGLKGSRIYLDFPSVGATENLMMAATLAPGETIIENAAREPEIVNLAEVLRAMGASIDGEGTGTIRIVGQERLHSASQAIIPDRIEASTYLLAGAITGGCVTVKNVCPEHLESLLAKLEEGGLCVKIDGNDVTVDGSTRMKGITLKTLPYPGFPTDMQPQVMALLCLAEGTSVIHESVFDSRYRHVAEFKRMGAKIDIQGNTAVINGTDHLVGAEVYASDLRAGAALVVMGLAARDETTIHELTHIWRGYENMLEKMQKLGAVIRLEQE